MNSLSILVKVISALIILSGIILFFLGHQWEDLDYEFSGIVTSFIGVLLTFMTTLISAMPA